MEKKLRLRALRREDAELTWKWRNFPDVKKFYSGHPFFVNPEKERDWYERILTSDHPNVSLGIEIEETETLIGLIFLMHINYIHRSAEMAFLFDKDSRKASNIIDAILLAIEYGFYNLNLNRIYGKTIEEHTMLINMLERYGGQREGLMRQSVFKDGKYLNEIMISLLKEDYEKHKRREVR